MQKTVIVRLGLILVCLSLALTACAAGQSPAGDKSGSGTAVPTAVSTPGYPAAGSDAQAQPTQPAASSAQSGQDAAAAGIYPAPDGGQGQPTQPPVAAQPTQAAAAPTAATGLSGLVVVKPDGSQATLSSADLLKLSPTEVSIGQSDQSGYRLSDVLAAVGIGDYQQVTVVGSGSTTLEKAQVTDDVILSTVDPTSLDLAGAQLSAEQMVKSVTQLQVK